MRFQACKERLLLIKLVMQRVLCIKSLICNVNNKQELVYFLNLDFCIFLNYSTPQLITENIIIPRIYYKFSLYRKTQYHTAWMFYEGQVFVIFKT